MEQIRPINNPSPDQKKDEAQRKLDPKSVPQESVVKEHRDQAPKK